MEARQNGNRPVLYLPYLPIGGRVQVGDWQLLPPSLLQPEDVVAPEMVALAQALPRLHARPRSYRWEGAVVIAPGQLLGHPIGLEELTLIRRALLPALLADNPDPLTIDDEQDPNAGLRLVSADHVQAWVYPVSEDGWIANERGGIHRILEGAHNLLREDTPKLPAPQALTNPILARGFDLTGAQAYLGPLAEDSDRARRLGRTIDWLDLAWRNTEDIRLASRIAMLHTGFETLLQASANAREAAGRLSELLEPPDAPRRTRPAWTTRAGNPVEDQVTDLYWWFMQFAHLRNAILHGTVVPDTQFADDLGRPHFYVAEQQLRAALTQTVAT